ncbi:uncharacterized protein LOC120267900 [Dioscorea cayenensis subsp. rotundata]|uniref:Uncharacterized protein LOC120267900 n=1 Tax=Dioscorea cayennensis subsp. rotundata TaxID=55577 RepID=A0AB40BXH3_DIOCR|nr:uncharacterized protein LOC120267900 [Dioscorea cayenensis subsp. rotundata]
MNEIIRTQLMIRIQKRRDSMKYCTTQHCPRILKKLEIYKQMSTFYTPTWSGGPKYQVVGPDGQFVVDKEEGRCSCRVWQLNGLPCSHAVTVIYYNNERPETYINQCYSVSTYLSTYGHTLNPTHGRDHWPKSDQGPMTPPLAINKKKGRRTMLRRKEFGEEVRGFTNGKVSKRGGHVRCGLCGDKGHNRRFHTKHANRGNTTGSQAEVGIG